MLPLVLAVGVHLALLLPAILGPHLGFWQRPPAPLDIQTVSLFSMADLGPAAPGPPPSPEPPAPPPPPEPAPEPPPEPVAEILPPPEEAVVIPRETPEVIEVPPPAPEPAPRAEPRTIAPSEPFKVAAAPQPPPEPISIRPSRTSEDEEQLQQLRESYRLEARARDAEREAETARRLALEALRDTLHARATPAPRAERPAVSPPTPTTEAGRENGAGTGRAGPRGDDAMVDAATREYLVRLTRHIQSYWSLPNLPTWDPELMAVIVITVDRNGTVRDATFEKRAENMYFNQLVNKTIDDAAPMPPFPAALRRNEMEIGLRFRPGEVF